MPTKIEWTDETWNVASGCTRVSEGCRNCYIEATPPFRIEGRHFTDKEGQRSHAIGSTTGVRLHPERLDQPLRWRRPRKVFVNSLSDLFHEDVPDEYIARVWAVMALSARHTFQVLTKRHGRMRSLLNSANFKRQVGDAIRGFVATGKPDRAWYASWPLPNVWLGVTVEDQERASLRIPALLDTPAAVRFLSCEPLLGGVRLCRCDGAAFEVKAHPFIVNESCPLHGAVRVDWVIAGGESGPDARPMHPDWARSLRDQCQTAGVPFLFKQWGEWVTEDQAPEDITLPGISWSHLGDGGPSVYKVGKKTAGRELDGRTWNEYPTNTPANAGSTRPTNVNLITQEPTP